MILVTEGFRYCGVLKPLLTNGLKIDIALLFEPQMASSGIIVLQEQYKEYVNSYVDGGLEAHASEQILLAKNVNLRLSIDENSSVQL